MVRSQELGPLDQNVSVPIGVAGPYHRRMSDSIFLIGDDGSLSEASSTGYSVEAELQQLLAENLDLLPGAQISPDNPPAGS